MIATFVFLASDSSQQEAASEDNDTSYSCVICQMTGNATNNDMVLLGMVCESNSKWFCAGVSLTLLPDLCTCSFLSFVGFVNISGSCVFHEASWRYLSIIVDWAEL